MSFSDDLTRRDFLRRGAMGAAGLGYLLNGRGIAPGQPPNFIVILCDNLGYGDIHPFGSTLHRTPNLDRMANEGRKFTDFYVTSGRCTPSRASLLTGSYAQRLGLHRTPRGEGVLFPISPYGLNPDEVTIAEILQETGIRNDGDR